MKWDQIERKWTLMTRRIRVDWESERTDATGASARALKRRDALATTIADGRSSAVKDSEFKIIAK